MEVVFPHICKSATPRPTGLLKPKYLRAIRTTRNPSECSRYTPVSQSFLYRSNSPVRKSRRTVTRPHIPACILASDTSKLGKNRITLLWTQKRAEPLSPLSAVPHSFDLSDRLELEGLKIKSYDGRPAELYRTALSKRSRPRPVALEIPSISLRFEDEG